MALSGIKLKLSIYIIFTPSFYWKKQTIQSYASLITFIVELIYLGVIESKLIARLITYIIIKNKIQISSNSVLAQINILITGTISLASFLVSLILVTSHSNYGSFNCGPNQGIWKNYWWTVPTNTDLFNWYKIACRYLDSVHFFKHFTHGSPVLKPKVNVSMSLLCWTPLSDSLVLRIKGSNS